MNFASIFALSSYRLSKFFVYAAVMTPLLVMTGMFFPFVAGKAIFFRIVVELALLFFIFYLASAPREVFATFGRLFRHPMVIAATVFVSVFLSSGITGVNFHYSFFSNFERGEGVFLMLHLYIFFLLLLILFPGRRDWVRLLKFSLATSVLIGVYAIAQKMNASWIIGATGRPSGTLGNPSYLSVYAMFHMLFALFVIYQEKAIWQKIFWIGAAALNLYSLVNAQTRGTLVGLAAAFFLALVLLSFAKYSSRGSGLLGRLPIDPRWIFRTMLLGMAAFAAFFLITRNSLKDELWLKLPVFRPLASEDILNPLEVDSIKSRYLTWTSAFAGFLERPLLGWGPENFPTIFDKFYNPQRFGTESWFDRSHDFILDYLTIGGIPLLAAYIAMFYLFYLQMFKKPKTVIDDKGNVRLPLIKRPYLLYVGFLVLPVAYLIQNLFLFDVLPIYIVLFLFFAFSIHLLDEYSLVADWKAVRETPFRFSGAQAGIVAGSAAAIIALIWVTGVLPYRKNLLIRESMAVASQEPFKAFAAYDTAIKYYSPVGQPESIEQLGAGIANLFSQLLQQRAGLKPEAEPLTIDFANEVLKRAEENGHVTSVKPYYLYGIANLEAAAVFRDPKYSQIAREIMEKGHSMAPARFEFLFGLMDVGVQQGDRALIEEMLKRGRTLRPDLEDRFARYEGLMQQISK